MSIRRALAFITVTPFLNNEIKILVLRIKIYLSVKNLKKEDIELSLSGVC
jgi:hypothetical protein